MATSHNGAAIVYSKLYRSYGQLLIGQIDCRSLDILMLILLQGQPFLHPECRVDNRRAPKVWTHPWSPGIGKHRTGVDRFQLRNVEAI